MDIETSEAIESLRSDLARVEASLTAEIGKQMTSSATSLAATLRGEMAEMRDDLKRHTRIQIEAVRDDIQLLAEGVATLSAKIDRL